ncbi:RNA polymerase sigma factor SigL [Anatilimnocola aggregata]|uniref:RNA polymerase sigma factor SigL n=1 Tax=Anatilimnocola aggregata TaxID=2528021 RepID=A0A517YF21_9BACT|nr:ECF-type sigma factor [Anatilimnocola aggregata]QDU28819.1 RNA polymerase sigma factor SigL [Anatilimnocola aggregata]
MADVGAITLLLRRIRDGEPQLIDELVAQIYQGCVQRAHLLRRGERPGHTLQSHDLADEGLMRLIQGNEVTKAADRGQLFWAFSRAVRQVLVEHARRRNAGKRGGDAVRVPLDEVLDSLQQKCQSDVVNLDEAIQVLAREYPEEGKVLEMHYFGEYSLPEIAQSLDVSLSTIERRHRFAKAWLRDWLKDQSI